MTRVLSWPRKLVDDGTRIVSQSFPGRKIEPAAANVLQQQARFDALGMKSADMYARASIAASRTDLPLPRRDVHRHAVRADLL